MGGFLGQTALNNGPNAGGNAGGELRRQIVQDGRANLESGASFEGQLSGSGFIEDDAKRPDVDAMVRFHAAEDLGSHVLERAGQPLRGFDWADRLRRAFEEVFFGVLGEAEVENFGQALGSDYDVGTL